MPYTAPNYNDSSASLKIVSDTSDDLDAPGIIEAQEILGCVLWYSRIVDVTTLIAVSKASTALTDKKTSINAHQRPWPSNEISRQQI